MQTVISVTHTMRPPERAVGYYVLLAVLEPADHDIGTYQMIDLEYS